MQVLAERRKVLIDSIYEVTGVSDIMRGSSNAQDTATAVLKKRISVLCAIKIDKTICNVF